jgi:peptide/nickel transport system substrate-binding protein
VQRRSRRGLKFAALGLALALTAGACGGSDDEKSDDEGTETTVPTTDAPTDKAVTPGGELTYAVEADASGGYCLPTAQLAAGGIQIANAIYDPLFVFDKDFKPQPYLAESFSFNPEYTALTIKLRSGITFQDGSPLNSEIVKLNLDVSRGDPAATAKTGLSPLLFIFVFQNIASIDAPDDSTVVINTKVPWPALPEFLAGGRNGIVGMSQLMAGTDGCKDKFNGTGPFKVISWTPNQEMKLEKNPNYWRKDKDGVQLPYLDKLTFKPIEGGPARFDALDGDTIQAGHWSTQSIFDQIQGDDRFQLTAEAEGHKEVGYGLVNVAKAPMDDKEFRKHLSMAIDRDTLNDINSEGKFKVANQPFDTGVIGYLDDIEAPEYDPDAAEAYFAGKNVELKLSYATDPTTKAIAEEVKAELADVGVTVNIDEKDQATLINQALGGDFNILLWRNHPGADPDTQYNWWHSGSPVNFGKINDPEMDRLLDEGRSEPDPAKRKTIYEDFNRAFAAGAYNQWNWYTEWGIGSYKTVHNLTGTTLPDGSPGPGMTWGWHLLTEAWVEQ